MEYINEITKEKFDKLRLSGEVSFKEVVLVTTTPKEWVLKVGDKLYATNDIEKTMKRAASEMGGVPSSDVHLINVKKIRK